MKQASMILLSALLLPLTSHGEQQDFGAGQVAAAWLGLPTMAKASAMGEAGVALKSDLAAAYSNPAGLAGIQGQQASLMHNTWIEDMAFQNAAYATTLQGVGSIGVGFTYLNFGELETFTLNGAGLPVQGEAIKPTAFSGQLSFARDLRENLAVGVTAKFISEDLAAEGVDAESAVAADLGALVSLNSGLSVGVSALNIGSQLGEADLPLSFKGGVGMSRDVGEDQLSFSTEVNILAEDSNATTYSLGLEYSYLKQYDLRVGYKAADRGSLSGLTGVTAGIGASFDMIRVDYSFLPQGDLGTSHQVSLGLKL